MKSRFDEVAEQLSSLNLQIKHDMERAEAKAEPVNRLVQELAKSGLLVRQALLGAYYERPYEAEYQRADSVQVVQAALLVPEGFGICVWDMEDFTQRRSSADGLEPHARTMFQAFATCSAAEKRFLLPFLEEMLEDLTDIAKIAAAKLEAQPSIPAEEYFARRKRTAGEGPRE